MKKHLKTYLDFKILFYTEKHYFEIYKDFSSLTRLQLAQALGSCPDCLIIVPTLIE